jgi:hypothetical protein
MASKPASWALVVPIDLNPAEQKWFREELTAGAAARCRWHGKTWLDACMAENPCVARYCLSNVTNELAALAVQLGAEKAALANGVPDAIERLRSLQALANEVDPFYYVDLATDGARGTVSASLRPRFPTAAQERPIVVEASLVFPDVETAQKTRDALKATYDFGTATAIPAGHQPTSTRHGGVQAEADGHRAGRGTPGQPSPGRQNGQRRGPGSHGYDVGRVRVAPGGVPA